MLAPWIIEETLRRERHQQDRPVLELALEIPIGEEPDPRLGDQDEGVERGVVVLDYRA